MNQIIAFAGSFIIGIGVVWQIFSKFSPKIRKALKVTKELTEALDTILDAFEDKKLTKQEVEKIRNEIQDIIDLLS